MSQYDQATKQQQLEQRFLLYISDQTQDTGRAADDIEALRALCGGHDAFAATAIRLVNIGYLRRDNRLGYHLTADGREYVEQLRQRQTDKSHRRRACRHQLLKWVDGKTNPGGLDYAYRSRFEGAIDGLRFTDQDTAAAAQYLSDKELIEALGSDAEVVLPMLRITSRGQDCTEDDRGIDAFLVAERQQGPTLNLSGDGNNVAFAPGRGSTATASQVNFNLERARELAGVVRDAAPVLHLTPEATAALEQIETGTPEEARRGSLSVLEFLSSTGSGTLGGFLAQAFATLLGIG